MSGISPRRPRPESRLALPGWRCGNPARPSRATASAPPLSWQFLATDVIGRLLLRPSELEVGVVLGVLGAPVFVVLVRYRRLVEL